MALSRIVFTTPQRLSKSYLILNLWKHNLLGSLFFLHKLCSLGLQYINGIPILADEVSDQFTFAWDYMHMGVSFFMDTCNSKQAERGIHVVGLNSI